MRKKYDGQLKLIYNFGMERILLSEELQKTIPKSTASTWRNLPTEKLLRGEYNEEARKNIKQFMDVRKQLNRRERENLFLAVRFFKFLLDTLGEKKYRRLLRNNKRRFIDIISNSGEGIDTLVLLKMLRVSPRMYHRWKTDLENFCTSSALHSCAKSNPKQLTKPEVDGLVKILSDPNWEHWSISSVYGQGFRIGKLSFGRTSAYKYNRLLEIRRKQKKGRKPSYRPLRATEPNEIWHADVSVFKTEDGKRNYIYAVIDNYSRKILAWDVSYKVSGYLSMKVLRKAIRENNIGEVQYITDGGPENDNWNIKRFLNNHHASIEHSIALRDIVQSNSMIEAVFRTMKSNYLYLIKCTSRKKLLKFMQQFVHEYNEVKPHFSLKYYTPSEIYRGDTDYLEVRKRIKDAMKHRYSVNKNCECLECVDGNCDEACK